MPTLAERGNADATSRARELIDQVGLAGRLDHRPAELSGGERQRVAIARALVNRPVLLLADEPTGNLDGKTAQSVADLLVQVHQGADAALIVVTHSEPLAGRFGRRLNLVDGLLAEH
jgi:lipoprotein-releasing system ATP-binding protein